MQFTQEVFNMAKAARLSRLQPVFPLPAVHHNICSKCRYVNEQAYDFCTNCGQPLRNNRGQNNLYNFRTRQRKNLLQKCEENIQVARNTLYILAAVSFTGIGLGFSELDQRMLLALVAVVISGLYFLLARWSAHRPFTALLVSVVIAVTCSVIALFGKIETTFTTVTGVYGLLVTIIVLYVLLRGLAAAFKADLVKEEMEII
jgi:hypothetical protein